MIHAHRCICLLALSLAAASPAVAATEPAKSGAKSVIDSIVTHARQLDLAAERTANAKTIESLVDFGRLASDALGDHSKSATAAERAEVTRLLRAIITRTVYPEAPKFFRDVQIQYTEEQQSGGRVRVTSIVSKGDRRSTVEYWLSGAPGSLRVVDLAIEGERWVENVRDQFDEVIRSKGLGGLISRMRKRANQLQADRSS